MYLLYFQAENTEYFHFPRNNKDQCEVWERKVIAKNGYTQNWKHNPSKDLICWEHFNRRRPTFKKGSSNFVPCFAKKIEKRSGLCTVPGCGSPLFSPYLRFFKVTKGQGQFSIMKFTLPRTTCSTLSYFLIHSLKICDFDDCTLRRKNIDSIGFYLI